MAGWGCGGVGVGGGGQRLEHKQSCKCQILPRLNPSFVILLGIYADPNYWWSAIIQEPKTITVRHNQQSWNEGLGQLHLFFLISPKRKKPLLSSPSRVWETIDKPNQASHCIMGEMDGGLNMKEDRRDWEERKRGKSEKRGGRESESFHKWTIIWSLDPPPAPPDHITDVLMTGGATYMSAWVMECALFCRTYKKNDVVCQVGLFLAWTRAKNMICTTKRPCTRAAFN